MDELRELQDLVDDAGLTILDSSPILVHSQQCMACCLYAGGT